MRIAMVALAGTSVGLLGGTGWGALHARDRLVATHALESETAREDAGPAYAFVPALDDGGGDAAAPDEVDDGVVEDGVAAQEEGAGEPAAGQGPGPDPAPVDEAQADIHGFDAEGARRLGRIFAAMKPAEAAGVLSLMEDAEAAAVLVQISDRQAAPILASLPVERAALLGRLVLAGRGAGR
jgi:hypothetical protein